jgi:beta-apo-4'-carotenal oxygenase
LQYRISQLRKLYWAINGNEEAICEACKLDLGRSSHDTSLIEVDWLKNDVVFTTQNLEKWMEDESAPDIPLTNLPLRPKIRKEPLGTVLIIGAYNVPFQLSIRPLLGAIAAGCTAVLKPSEVASNSAMIMQRLIEEFLDPRCYTVVNGGVLETSALLNEKWDKIFYTGGAAVGTIIAKKAAETLTPVCHWSLAGETQLSSLRMLMLASLLDVCCGGKQ